MNKPAIFESLESRTFFSLTPAQAVAADQAKIAADKLQLTQDRSGYSSAVNDDRKQLTADISNALTTAGNQIKADATLEKQTIQTVLQNGNATLASDRATINADKKTAIADRGNATAEAAALSKLKSDESILTSDSASLKATIANDRTTFNARLKTDTANLNIVGRNGDTAIDADRAQLTTDIKSAANAIGTDTRTLAQDEVQLAKDELAEVGSNLLGGL
jgi:hypothetical protein